MKAKDKLTYDFPFILANQYAYSQQSPQQIQLQLQLKQHQEYIRYLLERNSRAIAYNFDAQQRLLTRIGVQERPHFTPPYPTRLSSKLARSASHNNVNTALKQHHSSTKANQRPQHTSVKLASHSSVQFGPPTSRRPSSSSSHLSLNSKSDSSTHTKTATRVKKAMTSSGSTTSQKTKSRNALFKMQPYRLLFNKLTTVLEEDDHHQHYANANTNNSMDCSLDAYNDDEDENESPASSVTESPNFYTEARYIFKNMFSIKKHKKTKIAEKMPKNATTKIRFLAIFPTLTGPQASNTHPQAPIKVPIIENDANSPKMFFPLAVDSSSV